jgi:hypothetical protein
MLSISYWRRTNSPFSHVDVYDGFETGGLSQLWRTNRFAPGAVTMQSGFARGGHGAARVVLHHGDVFEAGMKGSADTERAELLEAPMLISREGLTYEYSFSEMIPADFPIVPTRLVIAQWKQECGGHKPCSDDSPVVAVRYTGGALSITRTVERRHRDTLYQTCDERRGRWTDFRFQIRFTPSADGIIRAWVDGRHVVEYRGATAYPENATTGYSSPSRFYFKMGLYRDVMEAPMTIYIDEYRKLQLTAQDRDTAQRHQSGKGE